VARRRGRQGAEILRPTVATPLDVEDFDGIFHIAGQPV